MAALIAGWRIFAFAAVVAGVAACGDAWQSKTPGRLPAVGADLGQTTVSGISSGAYMAGQFQLAHADIVTGAAIIAGGPYGCAESALAGIVPGPGTVFFNASRAVSGCMLNSLSLWGIPDVDMLADRARRFAAEGRIGSIEAVASDRVYLFTGRNDDTVKPPIVRAAAQFYAKLGVPDARVKLVDTLAAGHAFVTLDKGLSCAASASPFVEDCDYDQAGSLLAFLLGTGETAERPARPTGLFATFDQSRYTQDLDNHGLADTGMVYIPKSCTSEPGCRVHIAFHGCAQNMSAVQETFVRDTGYARWADVYRLVVLYPQTSVSALNPQGCWDWWGYTGRQYLTREAPQIVAVKRMIDDMARAAGGGA